MSNNLLQTDVYKLNQAAYYPKGMTKFYSYLESRGSREEGLDYSCFFGLQYYLMKYFSKPVTRENVEEFEEVSQHILGDQAPALDRFYALADLGYIPLKIKAVREGAVMPLHQVMMSLTNTHPDFGWLVNYVESLLLKVWLPITVASNSYRFRRMFNGFADRTVGNRDAVPYQLHCFGYRGTGSEESAAIAGAAHLLSFLGTDTIAAVCMLRDYYDGMNCERPIAKSVNANEHSNVCAHTTENDDFPAIEHFIDVNPTGIASSISDTFNLWRVITDGYCGKFKDKILERDGKIVCRPDSGSPEHIICGNPSGETREEQLGALRLLDEGFGSNFNEKQFREIDSRVGLIYGDGIFYQRAQQILSRMAGMGYASNQIVFGSGGLLLNQWSRDTLKLAIKGSHCIVNGEYRDLQKDPITDQGKRSKKGLLKLEKYDTDIGVSYRTLSEVTPEEEEQGELEVVYLDGEIKRFQTLDNIRDTLEAEETLPKLLACV